MLYEKSIGIAFGPGPAERLRERGGAAAGNGGGGSIGGGGIPITPPVNSDPPEKVDDVFSVGSKAVTVDTQHASKEFHITKTADGLVLNSNATKLGRSVTISWRDFGTEGNLLTASKYTEGRYSDDSTTDYKATDEIALGGTRLGLSHSDFGMWDAHDKRYKAANNEQIETEYTYTPFTMGDDSKKAHFASGVGGSDTRIFSGHTVAIAHGGGNDEIKHLVGTAGLSVDLANLADSDLYLTFPGFANFTIPIEIDPDDGAISKASSGYVSVTNAGTGKNLTSPTADVAGQFYGGSSNSPSEAVGSYEITSHGSVPTIVNGSFGVKR